MDPDVSAAVLGYLVEFVEQTTDFVGVADTWGAILYLNPAAQKALGVTDYEGLTIADLFPGDAFVGPYYDVIRPQLLSTGAYTGELLMNLPTGDAMPMYVSMTGRIGPGGETNGGVVYLHAITHEPGSGASLPRPTGVLARPAFDQQVADALPVSANDEEVCALVIIEVDPTSTTDLIGATAAESVMRALGERMNRLARTIDTVGLLDEHRLALLLRGVRTNSEAFRVANVIYESLIDPPVATPDGELHLLLRYGVALAKQGDDATRLIERASAATSRSGGESASGRHNVAGSSGETVALGEFQVALSHGYVRPYAQPVIEFTAGRVVGYRGLSRWHHQRLGILPATDFIDMIADTPLAAQVDFYIARELAAVLTVVTRDRPLRLYTPASRRLMQDVRVERYLLEIADAFHLSPSQIRLQMSRRLLEAAAPALLDVLGLLREAGIGLALANVEHASDIDAFAEHGVDEFFLSYELSNAADKNERRDVLRVVERAHDLGCTVGAVGVRSREQHDALAAIGCDIATGDLYGQPQLAHEID